MKKILISAIVMLLMALSVQAISDDVGAGIRVWSFYKNVHLVYDIAPNSPAAKSGLPLGAKIIKIDNVKVKKVSHEDVMDLLKGPKNSQVDLVVKDEYNKKQTYTITRTGAEFPATDELFELYWSQIAPSNYKDATKDLNIRKKARVWIGVNYSELLYWADKEKSFTSVYNLCKKTSAAPTDLHACLDKAVARQLDIIAKDEQIKLQQQAVSVQQDVAEAMRSQVRATYQQNYQQQQQHNDRMQLQRQQMNTPQQVNVRFLGY